MKRINTEDISLERWIYTAVSQGENVADSNAVERSNSAIRHNNIPRYPEDAWRMSLVTMPGAMDERGETKGNTLVRYKYISREALVRGSH